MRRRLFVLLWAMLLLSACMPPLTADQARATAVAGGCWPYGYNQPITPAPAEPVQAGTPTPSPRPTVLAYPGCTPQPGTPTATVRPTRVPAPAPQPTPPALPSMSGRQVIGQQPGYATNRVLAIHPQRGTAVVGWVQWGGTGDEYLGDVWVRAQGANGRWHDSQTINVRPVKKGYGGLGMAISPTGVISAIYGAGAMDGDRRVYLVESRDDGQTWSQPSALPGLVSGNMEPTATPQPTPTEGTEAPIGGGVLALQADPSGGLHALALVGDTDAAFHIAYAERQPGQTSWRVVDRLLGGRQLYATLALAPLPGGGLRRLLLIPQTESSQLQVVWSDDGHTWRPAAIETNRYLRLEVITSVSLVAVPRPDGTVAVVAAWGQYARGGVFAAVSLDGGQSFGREEIIAQHTTDGALEGPDGVALAGFAPSLAYDAGTDRVAAAWEEVRRVAEADGTPRIERRLRMSVRVWDAAAWRYAITPVTRDLDDSLTLDRWGYQGTLVGDRQGHTQWLLTLDTRNAQSRIGARLINLPAILAETAS